MLKQKIKRMVLTGAAVMVLLSTAAPAAMAAPAYLYEEQPNISGGGYYDAGHPGDSWDPCTLFPWLPGCALKPPVR